ncbi:MAG: porin [Pseudomonadota bacterium]
MKPARLILPLSLSLAMGATVEVAASETSIYASLRQSLLFTDSGAASGDTDDFSVVDQGSRIGLQGNQSFGEFSGFGRFEVGFDSSLQNDDLEVRLGYVGVSGNFGIVSVGSQWSAWDTYVGGGDTNFVSEGDWQNGTGRNGSTLKYAGRVGEIAVEADAVLVSKGGANPATGDAPNSGILDELQLAVGYTIKGVTLNAALIERDGGNTGYLGGGSLFGARISYERGPLGLSFAIAQDDMQFGSDGEETLGMKFRASYTTGPHSFLAVMTSADNEMAANQPLGVALGYQNDLSQRSRVALELSSVDPDIAGLDSSIEGGVMYRHDW